MKIEKSYEYKNIRLHAAIETKTLETNSLMQHLPEKDRQYFEVALQTLIINLATHLYELGRNHRSET